MKGRSPKQGLEFLIAIPTRGRAETQLTLSNLTPHLRKHTTLFCDFDERKEYAEANPDIEILAVPSNVKGIAMKRQAIVDFCISINVPYLFMIDDDAKFFKRQGNTTKLLKTEDHELECLFEIMLHWMRVDRIPVVGLSYRQGNNFKKNNFDDATRNGGFHGIDVKRFRRLGLRFDKQPLMEDFRMLLDLFAMGIPNRVSNAFCADYKPSGSEGGCSSYRDWELQKKCSEMLHEAFPNYVKVVEKTTKTAWKDFKTRFDVRVQWKKAYNDNKEL